MNEPVKLNNEPTTIQQTNHYSSSKPPFKCAMMLCCRLRSLEGLVWGMLVFVSTCMIYTLNQLHTDYQRDRFTYSSHTGRHIRSLSQTSLAIIANQTQPNNASQQSSSHTKGTHVIKNVVLHIEETHTAELTLQGAAMLDEIDGFNYFVEWDEDDDDKSHKKKSVIFNKNAHNRKQSNDVIAQQNKLYDDVIAQERDSSLNWNTNINVKAKPKSNFQSVIKPPALSDNNYQQLDANAQQNYKQYLNKRKKEAALVKQIKWRPSDKKELQPSHPLKAAGFEALKYEPKNSIRSADTGLEVIRALPMNYSSWTLAEIEKTAKGVLSKQVRDQKDAEGLLIAKSILRKQQPPAESSPLISVPHGPVQRRVYAEALYGRLGNNMFQLASLYGVAQTTRRTAAMSLAGNNLVEVFHLDMMKQVRFENVPADITKLQESGSGIYSPQLLNLPPRDVALCCYMQSWKYFRDVKTNIRALFRFKDWIVARVTRTLSDVTQKYLNPRVAQSEQDTDVSITRQRRLTYVGVHIRRSDYILPENLSRGYKPASMSYIRQAMDHARQKYPDVYFIVASDEIQWTKLHISGPDVYFSEFGETPVSSKLDLALLAHCNHTIITVGSFGWWAGFLAGGDVIYYKNWPGIDSEIGNSYRNEDYFPPHWKGFGD